MRSLISETLNKKLDEILTMCFVGNRYADRGMTQLTVKFVMPKTESELHPKLAHLYPKLADLVSSYEESRNALAGYGLTPADLSDYSSPQEFFEKMLDYMVDLESLCYEAYSMAQDEKDFSTLVFVEGFIEELNPVTNQCLLLVDKGKAYNGDWMAFDHNVSDFIILKE